MPGPGSPARAGGMRLLPVLGDGKCAVLGVPAGPAGASPPAGDLLRSACSAGGRPPGAAGRCPACAGGTGRPSRLPVPGQVNLRGLAPLVVAELLYGLQQRVRAECTSYCRFLRRLAQELRQAQVSSLSELPAQDEPVRRSLVNSLLAHLGRAFADPRTEIAKDRWDLTVLGHHGWLTFTGISQRWLREAVKGWAAHDLPRRRGRQAGARLHEIIGAVARLSSALRAGRAGHGEDPPPQPRRHRDVLHRLAFLAADGQLSSYGRVKIRQDAGRMLAEIHALGLTRPGGPGSGLADDFAWPLVPSRPRRIPVSRAVISLPRSCARSARTFPNSSKPSPAGRPGSRWSCSWTPAAVQRRSARRAGLRGPGRRRHAGAGLGQRQGLPDAATAADQRAHRDADHRAEARRP